MTRRKKKAPASFMPTIPRRRGMFRDPKHVKSVVLRMGDAYIDQLDQLCSVNNRSRRELIEILISEAAYDLERNPTERIDPI